MSHCFIISKLIRISVLFYIISVSCFVPFSGFLKIIEPKWGFSTIFLLKRSEFCHFFVPVEGGEFEGFSWGGGGSGLELTCT